MSEFMNSIYRKLNSKLMVLQVIKILFVAFLIAGCSSSQTPKKDSPPPKKDQGKTADTTKKYTDKDTRECSEVKDCEDMCGDIFKSRKHRPECEELSVAEVEEMEKFFNALEDVDEDDLEDADPEALENILNISLDPIVEVFKDISRKSEIKKKKFLVWFAKNQEEAELIINAEDEEFEFMEIIFDRIIVSPWSRSGLNQKIRGSDTFVEIALEKENEKVLEWLHSYFENKYCKQYIGEYAQYYFPRLLYPWCVFENYCGLEINEHEVEEKYFEYEFFTDLLDQVLIHSRKHSRFPDWWTEDITSDSLNSWTSNNPHDVCRHKLYLDDFI